MWIIFVLFVKIGITYGFVIDKTELGDKIDITEANFTVGEDITLSCTASDPLDICKWVHKNLENEVVMCSGTRVLGFRKSELVFMQRIFF